MRRHRTLIGLLAAVTALAMAGTALAVPPEGKGRPGGGDSELQGKTCEEYDPEGAIVWDRAADGKTFTVSLNGKDATCVDVLNAPEGTWIVDVSVGTANSVTVQLRSSVPGDWCWNESTDIDRTFEFPGTPASVTDACPEPGADGGATSIPDDSPALAFTAFYTGGKKLKAPVTIEVTLP